MTPALLLTTGLETALNQYLRLDPDTLPRVAALSGKVIAVQWLLSPSADADQARMLFSCYLLPGPSGIQVVDSYAGEPDVSIRGTPFALARRLSRWNSHVALAEEVEIDGDVQLGKTFQTLLSNVDIDWEEHLSQLFGDAVAHQFGNILKDMQSWGRRALDTLFQDTTEYFQEETRDLPPSGAVASFLDAVDTLRSDTDRLEARIRRLQQPGGS